MTDTNSAGTSAPPARSPFPAVRLLYAVGYGICAWLAFVVLIALAIAQFVVIAIEGKVNVELKQFCLSLIQYESELLGYIAFARDELPFPIGPFPKQP